LGRGLSAAILELRQFFELIPACPRQHDLVIQNESLIRDSHQVTAQAQEAADLEHREENASRPMMSIVPMRSS
jgi:hypothetical protein